MNDILFKWHVPQVLHLTVIVNCD